MIPIGESRFEIRNGYEGFKVDERLRTYTCRGWQLNGIPCEHGFVDIYFLHRDHEEFVSNWYRKERFASPYNHFIEGINGMVLLLNIKSHYLLLKEKCLEHHYIKEKEILLKMMAIGPG